MKTNKLNICVASAIVAALLTIVAKTEAAVCSVPSGAYPTIQSAASDPSCAIINVAPGPYNENVVVNYSTTINGAQTGNAVSGRTSGGPNESTVNGANPVGANPVFMIKAIDVTIDGFTIKNSLTIGAAVGVDVKNTASSATVANNIIDGINTLDTGGNGTAQGIYLEAGPDGTMITNNDIRNVHSNRSAKGITIGDAASTDPSTGVKIQGNTISNVTSDTRGGYGVSVNNGNGATSNSGLEIRSNTFTNIASGSGWVHVIGLEANTPGVVVFDNDITNMATASPDAIAVWFEANPSFNTASVTMNNFNVPATQYGIAVQPALTGGAVDGTCNWWNSPTGPTTASNPGGTGAKVSPGVNYNPWLIAPTPGGSCFGGNVPTTAAQCKNGGWTTHVRSDGSTFKNQGDCMQYVNTGK
jgi:hypothetical protein